MRGCGDVTFLAMVRDTIAVHGVAWAVRYYAKRMPAWEVRFWMRAAYCV